MTITFGLLVLGAYLLGSVPAAYLVARFFRGIDLRQYGSGHIGAGNLRRSTSTGLAIPVVFYDLCKGTLMVWIAQLLGLGIAQQVAVGLAVIIGHNWPVFLRFNGGRGVLTALGVALFLYPWGVIVFVVVALPTIWIKSSPLPVLAAMAALPLASWGMGHWGMGQPTAVTLGLLAIFLIMVIRRLTVPLTAISASVSRRELLVNRFLFDRDIRDGRAWVYRKPTDDGSTAQTATQPEKQEKGS